jgi:RNA polymerase sigma factor (sigma-70 family)
VADECWPEQLRRGDTESAWDQVVQRYHRLVFGTVRHYADDPDTLMELFTFVCESLRADDCARLRKYAALPPGKVRFSTWLVPVVRNLTSDWFRRRDGRRRLSRRLARLPPLERDAFQHVFVDGDSLAAAYETLRTTRYEGLTFAAFVDAVCRAQSAVGVRALGTLPPGLGRREPLRPQGGAAVDTGQPITDPPSESPLPDDHLLSSETGAVLREGLAMLSPDDRLTVELYVVEGLSAAEVASRLGLSGPGTVYKRVHRSLSRLREFLRCRGLELSDLT